MEILNNFSMIYYFITFILGAMFMFTTFCIAAMCKTQEPKNTQEQKNKVHFYLARDKNSELLLYIGKPFRGIDRFHPCQNGCIITSEDDFSNFGLNKDDYANLEWEDEPVEVFIKMED